MSLKEGWIALHMNKSNTQGEMVNYCPIFFQEKKTSYTNVFADT